MVCRSVAVLDLDDTLIVSRRNLNDRDKEMFEPGQYIEYDGMIVLARPYIGLLLSALKEKFDCIGVWSAGTEEYVARICAWLTEKFNFPFDFIFSRTQCSIWPSGENSVYVKRLELVAQHLNTRLIDIVLFDDLDLIADIYPGNVHHVAKYTPYDNLPNSISDSTLEKITHLVLANHFDA